MKVKIIKKQSQKSKIIISEKGDINLLYPLFEKNKDIKIITTNFLYNLYKQNLLKNIEKKLFNNLNYILIKNLENNNINYISKYINSLTKKLYIKNNDNIIIILNYKELFLINLILQLLNLNIQYSIISIDIPTILTIPLYDNFNFNIKNSALDINTKNLSYIQFNNFDYIYSNNTINYYKTLFLIIFYSIIFYPQNIDFIIKNLKNLSPLNKKLNFKITKEIINKKINFSKKHSNNLYDINRDLFILLNLLNIDKITQYIYTTLIYLILTNTEKNNYLAKIIYIIKNLNINIKKIPSTFLFYLNNLNKILKKDYITIFYKNKIKDIKINPNYIYNKLNFLIELTK